MKTQKLFIKDLSVDFKHSSAYLECYISDYMDYAKFTGERYPRPALMIIPGGGYGYCSDREALPIALRFICEGFNTFVLRYTCKQKYPAPHKELTFFINYLREHQKEFDITDDNISLIGFSAGGHLVGSYSLYYKELGEELGLDISNLKPLGIVLAYPVINVGEFSHLETRDIITNKEKELMDKLSIEKHVTNDYPPTYIFTTLTDTVVPPKNTFEMIEALKRNNVKYLSHIFEVGHHGGSLYTRGVYHEFNDEHLEAINNRVWVDEASDFLFSLIKGEK